MKSSTCLKYHIPPKISKLMQKDNGAVTILANFFHQWMHIINAITKTPFSPIQVITAICCWFSSMKSSTCLKYHIPPKISK